RPALSLPEAGPTICRSRTRPTSAPPRPRRRRRASRPRDTYGSTEAAPVGRGGLSWSLCPGEARPLQSPLAGPDPGNVPDFAPRRTRSNARMTRRYVNQLINGDSVDESFLVADKQLRANRQGNLYLHLELRDKTGSVGARLWNASEGLARTFEPGDYLHVRGKTQGFQGALQIILSDFEVVDSSQVEPEEFLPQSSQTVARLTARLREILLGMTNPHLRALVECFLIDEDFVRKFTTAPAGIKQHHAYQAGLL